MTVRTSISLFGDKDDTYYWDNILFLVENRLFKVPQYPFIAGSPNFNEHSHMIEGEVDVPATISIAEFQAFLHLLFPLHFTSTTVEFTKQEWVSILKISTLWHFNGIRKLAIQHLESELTDPVELIQLGRSNFIPRWLISGYASLVTRPEPISETESAIIEHLSTVRLYIIRHSLSSWDPIQPFPDFVNEQIHSYFPEEITRIKVQCLEYRTKEDEHQEELERSQALAAKEEEAERHQREVKAERRRSDEVKHRSGRDHFLRIIRDGTQLRESEREPLDGLGTLCAPQDCSPRAEEKTDVTNSADTDNGPVIIETERAVTKGPEVQKKESKAASSPTKEICTATKETKKRQGMERLRAQHPGLKFL